MAISSSPNTARLLAPSKSDMEQKCLTAPGCLKVSLDFRGAENLLYLKICWCELKIVCCSKKPQNMVNKCPMLVRGQDGIKDDIYSDKTQRLKYSEGGTWTCLTSRCFRDWNLSILCQSGDVRALLSGKYISLSSSRNVLFLKCQRMVLYPVIHLWGGKK